MDVIRERNELTVCLCVQAADTDETDETDETSDRV